MDTYTWIFKSSLIITKHELLSIIWLIWSWVFKIKEKKIKGLLPSDKIVKDKHFRNRIKEQWLNDQACKGKYMFEVVVDEDEWWWSQLNV